MLLKHQYLKFAYVDIVLTVSKMFRGNLTAGMLANGVTVVLISDIDKNCRLNLIQRDLDRLQKWEARWDIKFCHSKCQVTRVTSFISLPLSRRSIYCMIWRQRLSAVPGTLGWISPATSAGKLM